MGVCGWMRYGLLFYAVCCIFCLHLRARDCSCACYVICVRARECACLLGALLMCTVGRYPCVWVCMCVVVGFLVGARECVFWLCLVLAPFVLVCLYVR